MPEVPIIQEARICPITTVQDSIDALALSLFEALRGIRDATVASSSSSSSLSMSAYQEEEEEEEEDDVDRRFLYHSDVDDDALLQMDSNYHDTEINYDDDVDDDNTTTTSTNNNRHRSNWELNRTSTIALSTNITQSPTVAVVEGCEHQQSCDSCCEEEKECNERNDTYTKARSSF